jgi:hypothetical protein
MMITYAQALKIAKHPKYYHSENLKHTVGLLNRQPDMIKPVQAELKTRATVLLKKVTDEYPDLIDTLDFHIR